MTEYLREFFYEYGMFQIRVVEECFRQEWQRNVSDKGGRGMFQTRVVE